MLLNINQPSVFFQKGIRMRKMGKSNLSLFVLCLIGTFIALYHLPVLRILGMKSIDLLKKGKNVFNSKHTPPPVDEDKYVKPFVDMDGWMDATEGPLIETKTPTTGNVAGDDASSRYVRRVQEVCGELCDLTKPLSPGPFMGTVTAKVDCKALFLNDFLDRPSLNPPQRWKNISKDLQDLYSHRNKVQIKNWFRNNAKEGKERKEAKVFTEKNVNDKVAAWRAGTQHDTYKPGGLWDVAGSVLVDRAAAQVGVENKTVLVIGTQDPWLEAVLLARNPKQIITVEYGYFISEHPSWEIILPEVFRQRYLAATLPTFDLIFSYSSVEHSGLGRYGDSLNPFGDIITIARAWCVSSPQALLALGVPSCVQTEGGREGSDRIDFNAHRVYGPLLYPYLVTNWRYLWPTEPGEREAKAGCQWDYQPVYVFEKNV